MGQFEAALEAIEAEIASAQRMADGLSTGLKRARKAAQLGHIAELDRALSLLAERGESAASAANGLATKWTFDAKSYLGGGFLRELLEAASAADLIILERDGHLYAFPLTLRLERAEAALRVGKKVERGIRPSRLVRFLAAMQRRPLRFSEQRFLDLLYKTYERMVRREWRKVHSGLGPVIPLADIHAILTLLPGTDYPVEEFGRDLLLLDRKPGLRTRDGHQFRFPGSAMAKERVEPIKVYDEEGRERVYLGLAFEKEP